MVNFDSFNHLINIPFFYNDKETGIGWNIQIFNIYREADFDSIIVILTDNIKVELSHIDMVMGPEKVLEKILDSYEKQIGDLNV